MSNPLEQHAPRSAVLDRRQLVLVDGRTFAISDEGGDMQAPTHGLVHDDRRHLSRLTIDVVDADVDVLASSSPTALSAVVVARLSSRVGGATAVLTRRRWVATGLREDVHVRNTSPAQQVWVVTMRVAADFAHIFDVKAGIAGSNGVLIDEADGLAIVSPTAQGCRSRICFHPTPTQVDTERGVLTWRLGVAARDEQVVTLTVEPIIDDIPAGLEFPCAITPADAIPLRRLASWQASVPRIESSDPRMSTALDQALADIAALRIVDNGHLDRAVTAAGAPWFMTLFGRDSLLTAWMTLPFEPSLAAGVLATLADLQGRVDDPTAEEQPGKILHELRRRGGGGPFATRSRYYGTVDATPLFVMLAAEAWRWGAIDAATLTMLAPAVDAALGWILNDGDADGDGFIDYQRRNGVGLANQGWKDSWDGINFADGSMPRAPIALVEVQGYAYAALLGAAALSDVVDLAHHRDDLVASAERLRTRFNERFWDPRGWFGVGLDGSGRRIDALTTNAGHALWTGIADAELAVQQLDRFAEPSMWSGWGLRTLAESMAAYDPLSYHNGSVWPHDTALCAAGAAHYGRWDVVDLIVEGAFDAAEAFAGRPPELFAGISRDEAPMPVAYPSSCSPQAWSSASVLLLLRTMLGLEPSSGPTRELQISRRDLSTVPDLILQRVRFDGGSATVRVEHGIGSVRRTTNPAV